VDIISDYSIAGAPLEQYNTHKQTEIVILHNMKVVPEVATPADATPKDDAFNLRRLLSLRWILPLFVVSQVLPIVIIVWAISFASTNSSVNSLSMSLQTKTSDLILTISKNLLDDAPQIIQTVKSELALGLISLTNINLNSSISQKALWNHIHTFGTQSPTMSIYFGTEQGRWMEYSKFTDWYSYDQVEDGSDHVNLYYSVDDDGKPYGAPVYSDVYDPRVRPWYTGAAARKEDIWSKVYLYETPDEQILFGLTYSRPLYDENNVLQAVIGVDYTLTSLSTFLHELKVSKNGRTFITEIDGSIVAESGNTVGYTDRVAGVDSTDPLTAAANKAIVNHYKTYDNIFAQNATIGSLMFSFNSQKCLLVLQEFSPHKDLRWIIAIAIPQKDVLGRIYRNIYITIAITAIVIVFAVLLAIGGSLSIAIPLTRLSVQMEKVSKMQLDNFSTSPSVMYELYQIQQSFFKMIYALQSFRKFGKYYLLY
jgi:hypothetical protein